MRINNNISAQNTHRYYTTNNENQSDSLEKLSSGQRINKAADDAAGLAISEKMRGQIRGLEQAERNAQDGVSMIQTGEGALNESHSILQRMRELSVQASNDTYTDQDREEIQKEMDQLTEELDRISTDTEFNGKKLLDGSLGIDASIDAATDTAGTLSAEATSANIANDTYTVTYGAITQVGTNVESGGTGLADGDITTVAAGITDTGDYTVEFSGATNLADITIRDADGTVVSTGNGVDTTAVGGYTLGNFNFAQNSYDGNGGTASFSVENQAATLQVEDSAGVILAKETAAVTSEDGVFTIGDFELTTDKTTVAGATDIIVDNNAVNFQIGANEGQSMKASFSDMSANALGVDNLDVTTAAGAESAITAIDEAMAEVSAERSKLGAYQNRLDHSINNLRTSNENLTAAESRIRDVDMASEYTEYTKWNTLTQSSTSMLAQANQQTQSVLQLIQ